MKTVDSIQRKLRALAAVARDKAATPQERETAEVLKARLEEKLDAVEPPEKDWSALAFRLGHAVQEMKKATAPPPAMNASSKIAFRLGKALGHGLKKGRPS